jgi:hypothetical protein
MKLSPSWEAANCAATQKLPSILWKPKVHYRVHMSPPPVPILSQIDPFHPISRRCILILFTHLRLGLPSGSFLLAFPPISYMHSFAPHSCYMPCQSHPPLLDHSNYTRRRVEVMNPFRHFISLRSKHSPQHPVNNFIYINYIYYMYYMYRRVGSAAKTPSAVNAVSKPSLVQKRTRIRSREALAWPALLNAKHGLQGKATIIELQTTKWS